MELWADRLTRKRIAGVAPAREDANEMIVINGFTVEAGCLVFIIKASQLDSVSAPPVLPLPPHRSSTPASVVLADTGGFPALQVFKLGAPTQVMMRFTHPVTQRSYVQYSAPIRVLAIKEVRARLSDTSLNEEVVVPMVGLPILESAWMEEYLRDDDDLEKLSAQAMGDFEGEYSEHARRLLGSRTSLAGAPANVAGDVDTTIWHDAEHGDFARQGGVEVTAPTFGDDAPSFV